MKNNGPKTVLDAGTTWSKILEKNSNSLKELFDKYLIKSDKDKNYYIVPSALIKNYDLKFDAMTGHMSEKFVDSPNKYTNEIIALTQGVKDLMEADSLVLDLGSRDAKWVRFKDGKFSDLDWNSACASSTGATIEMLMKFYNTNEQDVIYNSEKYSITCGIFGLEKIMDDIAKGESAQDAIAKFIHGIAYNAWLFSKKPDKIYLSGGFCENKCFCDSLAQYTKVVPLGRFMLCKGII